MMESGDLPSILCSCNLPMTLQPTGKQGEYRFLGCAYIHGVMVGVAATEHEAAGVEDMTFRLVGRNIRWCCRWARPIQR
jgi:hypothetical protein